MKDAEHMTVIPNGGTVGDVPAELRSRPQWVGWKLIERDGKPTKVPFNPITGGYADSTDPNTWGEFGQALAGALAGRWAGVGFVFSASDPYCGIDLDDVIDPGTGEIDPDAAATVDRFASYAEVSQGGDGVHIIVRGIPPGGVGRKRGDWECYDRGRFFVVTGRRCSEMGVEERQGVLDAWHGETFAKPDRKDAAPRTPPQPLDLSDEDLIDRIGRSKQGDKFRRLWEGDTGGYSSGSEADLALASILLWWTQNNPIHADALFRSSGLMRPKWDAKRGDSTYGRRTLEKAAEGMDGGYEPATPLPGVTYTPPTEPSASVPIPAVEKWTHDELLGQEFGEQRWLVDGLVADESLTILGGVQKAGKSWMSIQLAQAVAAGDDFLGKRVVAGPVVYLALEDGVRRLQDRLLKQHSKRGLPILWYTRFPKLDGPDGMKMFTDVAGQKPRLIVIDTLAAAKTGRTDEQASGPMADLFNTLREVAQREQVAILVVHHHGKNVTGDPAHDLRGSSAIGAAADVLLGLYRVRRNDAGEVTTAEDGMPDPETEDRPDFYLKARGRDIEDSTTAITFGIGEDWLWHAAEHGTHDGRKVPRHQRDDAILAAVKSLGRATCAQVIDATNLPERTVQRRLAELMNVGRVKLEVGAVVVGRGKPPAVYVAVG